MPCEFIPFPKSSQLASLDNFGNTNIAKFDRPIMFKSLGCSHQINTMPTLNLGVSDVNFILNQLAHIRSPNSHLF